MKKIFNFIIISAFILVSSFYIKNTFISEKGKIKRIISKGEKAIEREDIIRCASFISSDYLDSLGNDRRNLIFLAEKFFQEYRDIFIHIESLKIKVSPVREELSDGVEGELARVQFIAKIIVSTLDNAGKGLAVEKGSERFMVIFRKEGGKWKVLRAEIPEYRFD